MEKIRSGTKWHQTAKEKDAKELKVSVKNLKIFFTYPNLWRPSKKSI